MLPTRFEIKIDSEGGGMMRSWETIKNYSETLDQEIDYAFRNDKVLISIELMETKSSWVA